ncbi:MAG: hypothetical protein ACREBX_02915 [Sphingopyxis sp.]
MHEREASRQPFRGLARGLAETHQKANFSSGKTGEKGGTGDAVSMWIAITASDHPGDRAGSGQKERAPAMPEPLLKLVSCLGLAASTVRAGAAHPPVKPTHLKSPVGTAHKEQLTERIP